MLSVMSTSILLGWPEGGLGKLVENSKVSQRRQLATLSS